MSTSSPMVSVAVIRDGIITHSLFVEAKREASRHIFQFFVEIQLETDQLTGIVADVGPGSFTGVKIALTIAKTIGYVHNIQIAELSSFDLIAPKQNVVIPSTRGRYYLREFGQNPSHCDGEPPASTVGYHETHAEKQYPSPLNVLSLLDGLEWREPAELQALYLSQPNISKPKTPFKEVQT